MIRGLNRKNMFMPQGGYQNMYSAGTIYVWRWCISLGTSKLADILPELLKPEHV
jgi:hypothetical protein